MRPRKHQSTGFGWCKSVGSTGTVLDAIWDGEQVLTGSLGVRRAAGAGTRWREARAWGTRRLSELGLGRMAIYILLLHLQCDERGSSTLLFTFVFIKNTSQSRFVSILGCTDCNSSALQSFTVCARPQHKESLSLNSSAPTLTLRHLYRSRNLNRGLEPQPVRIQHSRDAAGTIGEHQEHSCLTLRFAHQPSDKYKLYGEAHRAVLPLNGVFTGVSRSRRSK